MAITFIDSNTQDKAGGLDLTFAIPAGAQADDFMICFVKQCENTTQRFWDDDGGGGNGWIMLDYNRTTGGRDMETAIYYKIHSGSETDPTFTWASGVTTEPMSGSLLVYRGTDLYSPIQDFGYLNAQNDANPPNPSVDLDSTPSTVICFHGATHDDISAVAAPTGFNLRTQVWNGAADDHRNHFSADLSIGTSGSYTPPDWQHTVLNTTPEYHTYTVALQEPQPIALITYDNEINYGVNETITGYGFESTQSTGKVELWSDESGTIKVSQSIVSWSDTSITFTPTQGGLDNNAEIFLVITDSNSDATDPVSLVVGLAPYHAVVKNLSPNHFWTFDNTYNDEINTNHFTTIIAGGGALVATPICEENTHSWHADALGDRRECPNSTSMNSGTTENRLMGGWLRVGGVAQTLSCIYEEGGGVNNVCFFLGMGNVLIAALADTGDDNVQAYSNFKLEPDRDYHILFRFSYTDVTKEFRLYIDGVLQSVTDGNPLTATDLDSHTGDISIGGPGGSLEVGGTDVTFTTQVDTYYAGWVTWDTSQPQSTIDKLFQRGAKPGIIISSDTESNMQIALDAYADTIRPNQPLNIRIEDVSGGGALTLNADNITFNSNSTVNIEWRGTGSLTWNNTNGSDASNWISPTGGTVTFVNEASLSLSGLQSNSEVRIYTAGTQTELSGVENSGIEFSYNYLYTSDFNVDIVIHSLGYQYQKIENIALSSIDINLPIQQRVDRNYVNP